MKKDYNVSTTADKLQKKKIFTQVSKIVLLLLLLVAAAIYLVVYVLYNERSFTISVDKDMLKSSIFLSEDGNLENKSRNLSADAAVYMDNISVNWISKDVDTEKEGSHNGDNYFAYTFYLLHDGGKKINYWYQLTVDESIKDLDKAIRIMIYHNGEKTIYAKLNEKTKQPEEGTKEFYSNDIAVLEERKDFSPGDKDRFTVVVWIEGDDPDCNNELLGGGIKMHMDITEERTDR